MRGEEGRRGGGGEGRKRKRGLEGARKGYLVEWRGVEGEKREWILGEAWMLAEKRRERKKSEREKKGVWGVGVSLKGNEECKTDRLRGMCREEKKRDKYEGSWIS